MLERVRKHVCECSERDMYNMHEINLLVHGMLGLESRGDKVISEAVREMRKGAMYTVERIVVGGRKVGG